jgi:Ca-activated chloride channel family protein
VTWRTLAVVVGLGLEAAAAQPTFRARVEAVRLDVLVTRDGVPVAGLTTDDFDVRDNGVAQRVTSVTARETVQLGVVLDTSGSMTGQRIEIARAATAELVQQLTPRDTIAVVAFGDQVTSLARQSRPDAFPLDALTRLSAGGSTALVDGIYAGLLETGPARGPRLLLVMTDGRNNLSTIAGARVIDVARRLETAIYPVAVEVDQDPQVIRGWLNQREGSARQTHPSAFHTGRDTKQGTSDAMALLHVLADATGGRAIEAQWDTRLGGVFRGVLEEYRQRYIVTYTPEGVGADDGWHTLDVRVKRRGLVVRTRTRYWSG